MGWGIAPFPGHILRLHIYAYVYSVKTLRMASTVLSFVSPDASTAEQSPSSPNTTALDLYASLEIY